MKLKKMKKLLLLVKIIIKNNKPIPKKLQKF